MVHRRLRVTRKNTHNSALPDRYSEYATMMTAIEKRIGLDIVAEKLRLNRGSGYQGVDVFAGLLGCHSGTGRGGLRGWLKSAAPYSQQLAGIAGREGLPTQSSMSRALGAVAPVQADAFGEWLLTQATPWEVLADSPTIRHRDTLGQAWQVFDFDPTIQGHRQRSLPNGDDLPTPERRTSELAVPGHRGRKRGEAVTSYGLLQHAGSGLWAGSWVWPGGSAPRKVRLAAVARVKELSEQLNCDPSRCVLRTDGGISGFPLVDACLSAGISLITRASRYSVLSRPEVRTRLEQGRWYAVADSGGGPQRQALDLGTVLLEASDNTRREDGSRFAPAHVRAVASRYPIENEEEHRGVGKVLDGWCYEVFWALVPANAFPAAEVVTMYYGRTIEENRFGQMGPEIDIKYTYSQHLPGQALAVHVGLYLWNMRIALGACTIDDLGEPDGQLPRHDHVLTDGSLQPPGEAPDDATTSPPPVDSDQSPVEVASTTPNSNPAPSTNSAASITVAELDIETRRDLVSALDWRSTAIRLGPGWKAMPGPEPLSCPNGSLLHLKSVRARPQGTLNIRLRVAKGACIQCPSRRACTASDKRSYRREISATIPGMLVTLAMAGVSDATLVLPIQTRPNSAGDASDAPPRVTAPSWIAPDEAAPGSLALSAPPLNVRHLQHRWHRTVENTIAHVEVSSPEQVQTDRRPWLHPEALAKRQNRRRTWAERIAEKALPDDATVSIRLSGGPRIQAALNRMVRKWPI